MKVIKQFLAFAVAALFIVACNKSERFTPLLKSYCQTSSIIRLAAKVAEHQSRAEMTIYNLGKSQLPIIYENYASYNENTLMNKKETMWGSAVLSNIYPLNSMTLLWQNNLQKVEVAAVCYIPIFIEMKTEKQSL